MQKLLTIVVPSYNAEKYLRYNLDSLCLEEILDELEVIVVDDGSKDSTGKIIDEYAKRFPGTVIPIHKENGGHGSGINTGIRCATGVYFRVIDADDWADAEDLKRLVCYIKAVHQGDKNDFEEMKVVDHSSNAKKGAASSEYHDKKESTENYPDIIAGGFYWVYGHDETAAKKVEFEKPFEDVEYGRIYSFDDVAEKSYIKMHSMTIRTEILKQHDIRIDEKRYYVDNEYILYPIPYVKNIVFLDDHLYRYSISREGQSMSPQQMKKNKDQYDGVLESLYKFYESVLNDKDVSAEKRLYIEHLISRVYAGRIKILLWDKVSPKTKSELIALEEKLRKNYPGIYRANLNKAIKLLRMSRYMLYYPAAVIRQL